MDLEQTFKIGCCQVIPLEHAIQFNDKNKQTLQPKLIEVLCYLAENYPRIVPREELIESIWSGNNYVGEKALTNAIWHLRQKLGGASDEKEVIETIRKVGYRLLIAPQKIAKENNIHNTLTAIPFVKEDTTKQNNKLIFKRYVNSWRTALVYLTLCFLSFIFIWQYATSSKVLSTPKTIHITTNPGSEVFSSPSPDGRYIVYKWSTPDGDADLFMQDNQQPQLPPKQLTFDDDTESLSVWSNDGKYLYYAHRNINRGYCEVMQLAVESNQAVKLANCPLKGSYSYIDISPSNDTLAFLSYNEPADQNGIYFISLNENDAKPYRFSCSNNCGYREIDFAFSPDGKYIAVTRRVNRFNENIFLVNLETKAAEQLTKGEDDIVGLAWHPSGEQLIFATQRADIRNGFSLDISTKKTTPLNIAGFSHPSFAKKTKELYFQQRDEKYHISSLNLNSDIAITPFPLIQSDFSHHYPDYSVQSQRIVYASNETGYYELWSADEFGRKREQLTHLKTTIRYPRWSHDGSKVAFLAPAKKEKGDKIYILEVSSKKLSILQSSFISHNRPTWSFDDTSIISAIYDHKYADLHQISLKDGTSKRLTFDNGQYGIMISPTTMLYTRASKGLWQKDIDSNSQPLNKISGKLFDSTYTWNYQNNGVYFSFNHQISYYDFAKQQKKPLIKLPPKSLERYGTLTFIPDLNKIIFTSSQYPQIDIKKLLHPILHN